MAQQVVLNNRYRILGVVGEGGMAKVYKAEDRLLERTVAVKVLREQYASDEAFVERFRQEARAAAGLAHPNIVSVYDVGVDNTWNYIVMEYVEGPSLKELIKQGAPFTTARAVDIGLQILSGLSFAHQKGIVHRDIKPQNIIIGTDGTAKVTDFGIARAATSAQLTETGVVLGTVHYFSPEQARGEPATPASDLYSAGIVLFEMLTGRLPFEGDSTLGIALKHVQDEPPRPSQINPRVPPSIESIVLKSVAKDPEARYPNADAMKHALTTYRQIGEQVTSPINVAALSTIAKGKTTAATPALAVPMGVGSVSTLSRRKKGMDWFVITLMVLILGFLIASIPVAAKVYDLYFSAPVVIVPTSTPTPVPTKAQPTATASPQARVAVPRVVGMPFNDARAELEAQNLQIRIMEQQYDDKLPATTVITQTVKPGTEVQPGFIVDVVLSKGPEQVKVPNLIGDALDAAKSKLAAVGLSASVQENFNDTVAQGIVYDQKPGAESNVNKGSAVQVLVSKGTTPTTTPPPPVNRAMVPNVVGLPEAQAKQQIAAAGLANTYTNYQGRGDIPINELNKVPVGAVLSQTPAPGTIVDPGTTVYIAVRKQ